MKETTMGAIMAVCLAAVLIVLITYVCRGQMAFEKALLENGYMQVVVPGRTIPVWQKAE